MAAKATKKKARKKASRNASRKTPRKRAKKSTGTAQRKAAKTGRKKAKKPAGRAVRKWSHKVTTVSTYPPEGLFKKDAATIARTLASKRVSPKGIGSGIRMVQFFINRAGKDLPARRRRELEKAKRMLQEMREKERS